MAILLCSARELLTVTLLPNELPHMEDATSSRCDHRQVKTPDRRPARLRCRKEGEGHYI